MKLSYRNYKYMWICIILLIYCFFSLNNIANYDNFIYGIENINFYDNKIFLNNFSLAQERSPRFFMNLIYAINMKIFGLRWEEITIYLTHITILVMILAIVNIIFSLTKKNQFFLSILLTFFLQKNIHGNLAGFSYWSVDVIGLGVATSFTILGLSYILGEKKIWDKSLLYFCLSLIFHIHEGIAGFIIFILVYIIEIFKVKKLIYNNKMLKFFTLYIVLLFICGMPGLNNSSRIDLLDSEAFMRIYASFRAPHHLIPTMWGRDIFYTSFGLIYSYIIYNIINFTNKKNKNKIVHTPMEVGFILFWFFLFFFIYIFTEIYPNKFIIALYLPKIFKYISLIGLIWVIKALDSLLKNKKYYTLLILVLILIEGRIILYRYSNQFTIFMIILLYSFGIIINFIEKKIFLKILIFLLILSYIYLLGVKVGGVYSLILIFILLFQIILTKYEYYLRRQSFKVKIGVIIVLLSILIFSTKGKIWEVDNFKIKKVSTKDYFINLVGEELYMLAIDFNKLTNLNDVFLTDPFFFEATSMQLISKRNCYVIFKNVPSYQSLIKGWYNKIRETENLFKKDINDIIFILEKQKIKYILVKKEDYLKFENNLDFKVFCTTKNDNFRIYKLVRK